MVYSNLYLVDYMYFKVSFQCNSKEIESKENDILNGELYNVVSYGNGENEFLGMNVGWYVQRDNFESWCELNDLEMYEVTGNILDNI